MIQPLLRLSCSGQAVKQRLPGKTERFVFLATPLPEALRMLEKRFNVNFVLSNDRLRSEAFNGTFTNQRLERILEIFKISSNIKWRYLDTQNTTK